MTKKVKYIIGGVGALLLILLALSLSVIYLIDSDNTVVTQKSVNSLGAGGGYPTAVSPVYPTAVPVELSIVEQVVAQPQVAELPVAQRQVAQPQLPVVPPSVVGGGAGELLGGDEYNVMDTNTGGGAPQSGGGGCPAGNCELVVISDPPQGGQTYTVTSLDGTVETFSNQ